MINVLLSIALMKSLSIIFIEDLIIAKKNLWDTTFLQASRAFDNCRLRQSFFLQIFGSI